jgi:hypothetical protein
VDHSARIIEVARTTHPDLEFHVSDAVSFVPREGEKFDYIVLSNLVGDLVDVQRAFAKVRQICSSETRVIITLFSYLWQPAATIAELLGLKARLDPQNWLTPAQIINLFELAGLDVVTWGRHLLMPVPVPVVSSFANRVLGPLPLINNLCLNQYFIARRVRRDEREFSVSVIVPCKEERGNVAETVRSIPRMGTGTEVIFVDGHSVDGTPEEVRRCEHMNPDLDRVTVVTQDGRGKADAVRKGFAMATGEILMILDADNTVRGEELPKFYDSLVRGQGEFINGSRLVFPMEKQAMRHLNLLANHFFGLVFSWVLGQRISDTLCGTKVLTRENWKAIERQRGSFGVDPFGDFDLLFGAAKADLKIREIPIRYRAREYGEIKIQRFRNGLELMWMVVRGFRVLKQM